MSKQKIVLITPELIASGVEGLAKAISDNAAGAAADIILIAQSSADAEKAVSELSKKHDVILKSFADLGKENDTLSTINEGLSAEVERLSKEVKVAAEELPEGQAKSFQHDGKTYLFNFHKISHKGRSYTSAEIARNEALQKELIEIQSGMLRLQE